MPDTSLIITVAEAADRLKVHPETVRRRIRAGELEHVRAGAGRRGALGLYASEVDHVAKVEAHEQRMRESGVIVGRGDEFLKQLDASPNSSAVKADVRAAVEERDLFDRVARELHDDHPFARERLAQLDEQAREEAEAQEVARRMRDELTRRRRAERIYNRALEILAEDDDGEPR